MSVSFLFIVFCIFQIIIDLNNIKYNKVNNVLSVLMVCASLICPGGICPGGTCPGVYVPGGKYLRCKCPEGMSLGKCPGGRCRGGGGGHVL